MSCRVSLSAVTTFGEPGLCIRFANCIPGPTSFRNTILRHVLRTLRSGRQTSAPARYCKPVPPISALADLPEVERVRTPREAIDRIQTDLKAFREKNKLQQVVVVNVASTEPPFETGPDHSSMERLNKLLDRNGSTTLPASSIYATLPSIWGCPMSILRHRWAVLCRAGGTGAGPKSSLCRKRWKNRRDFVEGGTRTDVCRPQPAHHELDRPQHPRRRRWKNSCRSAQQAIESSHQGRDTPRDLGL